MAKQTMNVEREKYINDKVTAQWRQCELPSSKFIEGQRIKRETSSEKPYKNGDSVIFAAQSLSPCFPSQRSRI